ncbi:hypothetical protein K438DRAFT_1776534 [Mycena galopus ATCC 62051]|nr:hypothetical protein K438DRAFT_1776534 [Mycena galopus ATCC 62051]
MAGARGCQPVTASLLFLKATSAPKDGLAVLYGHLLPFEYLDLKESAAAQLWNPRAAGGSGDGAIVQPEEWAVSTGRAVFGELYSAPTPHGYGPPRSAPPSHAHAGYAPGAWDTAATSASSSSSRPSSTPPFPDYAQRLGMILFPAPTATAYVLRALCVLSLDLSSDTLTIFCPPPLAA